MREETMWRALIGYQLLALLLLSPARADEDPGLPPGAPAAHKDEVRRTSRVLRAGPRCYLASTVGVVVADCGDPERLRYLGALALPDSVNDLCLVGDRLAIANGPSGLVVARAGDLPRKLGAMVLSGAAMGVAGRGDRLLVASGSAGLHLLEIKDPARPRRLDHWETSGYAREVHLRDDLAALADGDDGVHLFRLAGDRLSHVSSVRLPGPQPHAFSLAFAGGLLLVAAGPAGLLVVDIGKPERPRLLGRLPARDAARGVSAQGRRAVVAEGTAGVVVVDLKNPAAPRETGRFKPERSANRVLLEGDLAFVANDYDGLLVLRLPEQGDPVPVGRLPAARKK
jgi:hypothetical protein